MGRQTTIQLFKNIRLLVEQSKKELFTVANTTLTETYFHVGRLIVEYEQHGSNRASYAKETLLKLSQKLSAALGKGFSVDNLENMRKFYLAYKDEYNKHLVSFQKSETLSRKLPSPKKSEPLARKSDTIQKSETLSRKLNISPYKLSWSHYLFLLNIDNLVIKKKTIF